MQRGKIGKLRLLRIQVVIPCLPSILERSPSPSLSPRCYIVRIIHGPSLRRWRDASRKIRIDWKFDLATSALSLCSTYPGGAQRDSSSGESLSREIFQSFIWPRRSGLKLSDGTSKTPCLKRATAPTSRIKGESSTMDTDSNNPLPQSHPSHRRSDTPLRSFCPNVNQRRRAAKPSECWWRVSARRFMKLSGDVRKCRVVSWAAFRKIDDMK